MSRLVARLDEEIARFRRRALRRLKRRRRRWYRREPVAVTPFTAEVERRLLFYRSPRPERRRLKTSTPIERFIGEPDKKFERVGVFPTTQRWERATYPVYSTGNFSNEATGPHERKPLLHILLDSIGLITALTSGSKDV